MNVLVRHRSMISKGFARLTVGTPIVQKVAATYSDGRIRTVSGDTWNVKKVGHRDYGLMTIDPVEA